MTIEFRCGNCRRLLRVGDEAAGQLAQCPECGAQTPVPPAGAGPEGGPASGPEVVYPQPPYYRPPFPMYGYWQMPGRGLASLMLGVLGLFLCLFGCCCGCVVFLTLPLSIAGLILGIRGLHGPDRTEAILGIVFCSLVLAVSLGILLLQGLFMAGGHGRMMWR